MNLEENEWLVLSFDTKFKMSNGHEEEEFFLNLGISSKLDQIIPIKFDQNLSQYQHLELKEGKWEVLSGGWITFYI